MTGIRSTNIAQASAVDELVGNRTQDGVLQSVRISVSALGTQIAAGAGAIVAKQVKATFAQLDAIKATMAEGDIGLVMFDPDEELRGQYALESGVLVRKDDLTETQAAAAAALAKQYRDEALLVAPEFWESILASTVVEREAATVEADRAEDAADVAQLAYESALASGTTYPDITTGRAAVADNEFFKVAGTGNVAYTLYKRLSVSTEELVFQQASKAYLDLVALVTSVVRQVARVETQVQTSTSGIIPLLVSANQVLVGVDGGSRLIADITALLNAAYGPNDALATVTGDVIPMEVSADGKVLLGFDRVADQLVGAFPPISALSRGQTIERPASGLMDMFYDNTISKPMFWNNGAWLDAAGAPALPILYDDFSGKADGPLGDAETGQTWLLAPAGMSDAVVEPYILDGEVQADDSGNTNTATYWGVDAGQTIKSMFAEIAFGAGTTPGGSATLISNPNGAGGNQTVHYVTDQCIHATFTDTKLNLGYFSGGDRSPGNGGGSTEGELTSVAELFYSVPLPRDGITWRPVGFWIDGDDVHCLLPDGTVTIVTSAILAAAGGPFGIFEHYWTGAGRARPKFRKVSIN